MDWKEMMFKEHVPEFIEILGAKQISVDTDTLDVLLGQKKKRIILDLACGTGRLLTALSEYGSLVVGLDYSESLLSEAFKKTKDLPNAVLLKGDITKLTELFLPGQFDLIIKAYTSLGYFPSSSEEQILIDCHTISSKDALLIIDTFNSDWFMVNKVIERETKYEHLTLKEYYHWDEANHTIRCKWEYASDHLRNFEIPFNLEGYNVDKIDEILYNAGWKRELLIDNLETFTSNDLNDLPERLVVVAKKITKQE